MQTVSRLTCWSVVIRCDADWCLCPNIFEKLHTNCKKQKSWRNKYHGLTIFENVLQMLTMIFERILASFIKVIIFFFIELKITYKSFERMTFSQMQAKEENNKFRSSSCPASNSSVPISPCVPLERSKTSWSMHGLQLAGSTRQCFCHFIHTIHSRSLHFARVLPT